MNTEITLPVPELKTALSGLNKMVGKKTTLPVLSCVKISRKTNGLVTMQATDLDAHATFTLNNPQPGEVVDVLVPLEQLAKASKCSKSDEAVALICDDKSTKLRYFIGGSPVNQPVNTLPVKEWPVCPEITAESTPLQPGFGEALKQAMQCCSQDPSRYILRGACLDATDKKAHYIVATNGRFLFSANSFTFPLKNTVIIPDSKFINGSGLLDDEPCFLAVQPVLVKQADAKPAQKGKQVNEPPPNLICLRNKQWEFVTKEIEGQYPNWKQVVPTIDGAWTLLKLQPSALEQLLKVIPNLPGRDGADNKIKLRLGQRELWVEGINKDDKEWTSIAIPDVTITGKPKEICLNRDYLLPALKYGLNELAILNELSAMVCSREGKKMVIMPVRLNGPAPQTAKPQSSPETSTKPPESTPATTPATTPPRAEVQTRAEERKTEMAKTSTTTTTTETPAPDSPFKLAMQQVDGVREALKTVLRDLASITDTLKVAEKDKKSSDKELDQFRDKLREIQGIKL